MASGSCPLVDFGIIVYSVCAECKTLAICDNVFASS